MRYGGRGIEPECPDQISVAGDVGVRIDRCCCIAGPALHLSADADEFDVGDPVLLADAVDHELPVDQERAGGARKEQRVCAFAAIDLVDPQTTVQRVVAGTTVQRVIAAQPRNIVV